MRSRDDRLKELERRVADACGVLNVAHSRLVQLTAELIDTELWRGYGIRSVEHWLTLRAGISPERARQVVQVAAVTDTLPVTTRKLADGELSFEQAHAVARHPGKFCDEEAAAFAAITTVPQIRRTLSRYTFQDTDSSAAGEGDDGSTPSVEPTDTTTSRTTAAVAAGTLSRGYDGDRFWMRVDAPADQGALIDTALGEAKNALFEAGHPNVSEFDALLEVCNRSLAGTTPSARLEKYRVYVHLDSNAGWLNAGPALPPALLAKLTCNGSITPVWETGGKPVSVGRTQRIVPDRTRRLVQDRDRGCRFPGCTARGYLEVHHIIHWRDGGPTDTCNLACLCPHHHDAHHRGDFLLTGNADQPAGLRFTDNRGNSITLGAPTPPTGPPPTPPPGHRYRHPSGEPLQQKWVHFTPVKAEQRTPQKCVR